MSGRAKWACRAALLLLAAIGCSAVPWKVLAQTPSRLAYRQVFVPQEAIESQILGLLPLKRDEFERRLKLASAPVDSLASHIAVRVDEAIFRARLNGAKLQGSAAELTVVANSAGPALLSLEPCNVALESAAWADEPDRPALVATDPGGTLVCVVERSGTLRLDWSLQAAQTTGDLATFDVRLPAAPRSRLEVETPDDIELTADWGIVKQAAGRADQPSTRIWIIELGGRSQTRLNSRPARPRQDDPSLITLRESASYTVLRSTLDLETTFTLDALREFPPQLLLRVDPALRITGLRWGEEPLTFSTLSASTDRPTTLAVQLPAGLTGPSHELQISATSDWPADKPCTLPRVVVADGIFQEGRVTIRAPAWLQLHTRPLRGCLQTGVTGAVSAGNLDQFHYHLHAADAAIEIASDRSEGAFHEFSGTQISVDPAQVKGVLIAELSSLGGERFAVEALLPRQWVVDSVETQPTDMLADRSLAPRGPDQQALRLNLVRAIGEGRSLRLVIRAHYRRSASQQPPADDFFRLAIFPEARECRRLVAVRVDDPGVELQLAGDDDLVRLDPHQLSPAELLLFEPPPGPLLVEIGAASDGLRAALVPMTSRYRADVVVQALAAHSEVRQTVSIRCQPESSAVASLLVRLAPRPPSEVTWRLRGEESRQLQATLVGERQQMAVAADEASYRLTLQRPRSGPFEVLGEWSGGAASGREVSLAWLPEAVTQTGLVEIHSQDGGGLSIAARDVLPLPPPPASAGRFTTLRARYRYETGRRAQVRIDSSAGGRAPHSAWVEMLQVDSRFAADGRGEHEATFTIQNAGLSELRVRLPDGGSDFRLLAGENDAGTPLSAAAGGEMVVPLPAGRRRADIHLRFSSDGRPLGWLPSGRFAAPIPQIDVPVVARRWTVALPPGLATLAAASDTFGGEPASARPSPEFAEQPPWLRPGMSQKFTAALAGPSLAAKLWQVQQPLSEAATDPGFAGWTTIQLDLPEGIEAALTVYRPAVVQAWSLSLALATMGLVLCLRRHVAWVWPSGGMLAAGAMISTPPLAWLLAGACAGLFAGGVALWFRSQRTTVSAERGSSVSRPAAVWAGGPAALVLLGCWFFRIEPLRAAPPNAAAQAQAPRYRVVIPVDDMQQPVGDYVFLDTEFYEALHRLTEASATGLPPFILENSRYELPAAPRTDASGAAVDELRVQLDFHTFRPSVSVELPLRRDQILLLEGRARLDGRPVTLSWRRDGAALSLAVDSPGKHHLELAVGAVAKRTSDNLTLDLTVPPAARSTAIVPAEANVGTEFPLTAGGEQPATASAPRQINLGAARRLVVRWPIASGAGGRPTTVAADQLLWWKIRPGSVVLEGHFRLHPLGGTLRDVLLSVDPRLRLRGAVGGVISRVEESGPNVLRVELAEPSSGEVNLRLSWLWPDVSGSGALALPRVAIRADRVQRAWTAVSTDVMLQAEAPPEAIPAAAEFVEAWGEAAPAPSVVFASSPDAPLPLIVVRPVAALPHAEQTIDWSLSDSGAAAGLNVRLTGVPPTRLEHRVAMPPQLKVTHVSLAERGQAIVMRWSQRPDGQLVVTLLEAPAAEQVLTVSAEISLPRASALLPLPAVRLEDVTLGGSVMRIYRQNDVQVRLQEAAGWRQQDEAGLGNYHQRLGRLVAVLNRDAADDAAQPVISRAPNQPQVSGVMFICAREDDGDWRCEVELALDIAEGLLDQVRLVVPEEWSAALEIETPGEGRTVVVPGERERQIVFRPPQAATDHLHVTIRGPLTSGGTGLRAPDVRVLGVPRVQRLVLLDSRSGGERIDWETTGLAAADPEAVALPSSWQVSGGELYRVVAPRFNATARVQRPAQAAPHVSLADSRAWLQPGRRVAVVSTYAVHPAGARGVTFELPPGQRVLQVLVDGVLAQYKQTGLRTWQIAAPSDTLPYRLKIVCDGAIPISAAAGAEIRLAAPRLIGMQVEHSIWSVSADGLHVPAARVVSPLKASLPAEAELVWLEVAASALEDVVAVQGGDLPAAVVTEDFQRWRQAFHASRRRLQGHEQSSADDSQSWAERLAAAERIVAKAEQRSGFGAMSEPDPALAASESTSLNNPNGARAIFMAQGPAEELLVRLLPETPQPRSMSAVWAGLLALASLLLVPLRRWRAAADWLAAHAHLLLALAGLAWWLLAPLGWLGWALVLTAIWLSLGWPWRRGGAFDPASSIRRLPLTQTPR